MCFGSFSVLCVVIMSLYGLGVFYSFFGGVDIGGYKHSYHVFINAFENWYVVVLVLN